MVLKMKNKFIRIVLDDSCPRRGQNLTGKIFLNALPGVGVKAKLTLTWTDALGGVMYIHTEEADGNSPVLYFNIPTDRAVTAYNQLRICLEYGGESIESTVEFFVVLPPNKLDDYNVVMYYAYKKGQQNSLRKFSIYHGKMSPMRNKSVELESSRHLFEHGFTFYCDQTAVPLYAEYHSPRYRYKHQKLDEAKALYLSDKTSKEAFIRKPSFHDEEAVKEILDHLYATVRNQMRFKPLFYGTDEVGVADLVAAWDFDFDYRAIAAFREWLRGQYGSLDALNAGWGTDYKNWGDVMPPTTDK